MEMGHHTVRHINGRMRVVVDTPFITACSAFGKLTHRGFEEYTLAHHDGVLIIFERRDGFGEYQFEGCFGRPYYAYDYGVAQDMVEIQTLLREMEIAGLSRRVED